MSQTAPSARRIRRATWAVAAAFGCTALGLGALALPSRGPAPSPTASAPVPAAPKVVEDPRIVATFRGGAITMGEVMREWGLLPPSRRNDSAGFLVAVSRVLATRKALANEARRRKLAPAGGGDGEDRLAVRALLAAEHLLPPPASAEEAGPHQLAFLALVTASLQEFKPVPEALLAGMRDPRRPIALPPAVRGSGVVPFWMPASTGSEACQGTLHLEEGWWEGRCDRGGFYVNPEGLFYLESVFGPVEGFVHRLAQSGQRTPARPPPSPMSPEFEQGYSAEVGQLEVSGKVNAAAARELVHRLLPSLRSCLAAYHWNNQYYERSGDLVATLDLLDGQVRSLRTEVLGLHRPPGADSPERGTNQEECLSPLREYLWTGTGRVSLRLRLEVRG